MLDSETIHIAPEQVFAAELRRAWEVIRLLILVQSLDVIRRDIASPLYIEILVDTLYHVKPCILARIDHSVVNMGRVSDFERHEKVVDLLAIILANAVCCSFQMHIAWIREESRGRSIIENGLEEINFLSMWLKHAVR